MRKITSTVLVLTFLLLPTLNLNNSLYAQKTEEKIERLKSVYFDLGYGFSNLSAALGFRYWNISASMGIAGFATNIPNYSRQGPDGGVKLSPNEPLPNGFDSEDFPGISVFGDLSYHYDLTPDWSVWGSVGFFSQRDSTLAREIDTGQRFFYKSEGSEGITFGAGAEYIYSEKITFGLGLHSVKGIHGRIIISWF